MRRLILLVLCLGLVACYTSGKRGGEAPMTIYDFGPPASPSSEPVLSATVALEVRAPLWADSMGLVYRLAYVDATRPREYARSRWAGPPSQMIQQHLALRLGLAQAGRSRTACVLRLEIAEFSQIFDTPTRSRAVLSGKLQLLDRQRREAAVRPVHIELAATGDAEGGARALAATVDRLAQEVSGWQGAGGMPMLTRGCAG